MLLCIKQHIKAKFEAPFMKKLSNTGAEKKSVAYKERVQPISCHWFLSIPPENTRKPLFL